MSFISHYSIIKVYTYTYFCITDPLFYETHHVFD